MGHSYLGEEGDGRREMWERWRERGLIAEFKFACLSG